MLTRLFIPLGFSILSGSRGDLGLVPLSISGPFSVFFFVMSLVCDVQILLIGVDFYWVRV